MFDNADELKAHIEHVCIMLNARDEVKALMNEFASLKTAGQEVDFKRKMDALLNAKDTRQRDKFGKAMVEGAREVMAEADVLIESLMNTI